MSTDIYRNEEIGLVVTRFWGSSKRGVCFQITMHEDYVQLNKKQFRNFLKHIQQEGGAMMDEGKLELYLESIVSDLGRIADAIEIIKNNGGR